MQMYSKSKLKNKLEELRTEGLIAKELGLYYQTPDVIIRYLKQKST